MIFTGSKVSNPHVNTSKVEVCIHSPTQNSIQMNNVKLAAPTSISKPQRSDGDDSLNTLKDKHNKTTNVPSSASTAIIIQINYQAANQPLMVSSEHQCSCGENTAHSTITSRYRKTVEKLVCFINYLYRRNNQLLISYICFHFKSKFHSLTLCHWDQSNHKTKEANF